MPVGDVSDVTSNEINNQTNTKIPSSTNGILQDGLAGEPGSPDALSPTSIYRTASFHDRIMSQEMRRRKLDEIQEAREKAEQEKEEQEAQKGDKYSVEAAKKKAEAMAKAQFHAERRGAPRIVSSSSLAVVSLS